MQHTRQIWADLKWSGFPGKIPTFASFLLYPSILLISYCGNHQKSKAWNKEILFSTCCSKVLKCFVCWTLWILQYLAILTIFLHVRKVVNYLVTWIFCNTCTSQSQVDEVTKQSFVASNNGKIILLSFFYLCYFYVIYYLLSCYCRERNIFAA